MIQREETEKEGKGKKGFVISIQQGLRVWASSPNVIYDLGFHSDPEQNRPIVIRFWIICFSPKECQ